MRTIVITSLILIAGFISACKKDYVYTPPPIDPTVTIHFSTDIYYPIIQPNCLGSGCHNGANDPDLSSAATARASLIAGGYVDSTNATTCTLYARITDVSSPMPPSGLMTSEKTQKILAWLKQGYKNN